MIGFDAKCFRLFTEKREFMKTGKKLFSLVLAGADFCTDAGVWKAAVAVYR